MKANVKVDVFANHTAEMVPNATSTTANFGFALSLRRCLDNEQYHYNRCVHAKNKKR
jgi:hypothetical protein